ncbi:MAG: hypothetical protein UZ14_CFX002002964 [Chloroflexi bacterium OLB14]|nr:MAG: hypothetical protein UZ14_CFX002002964 [Chloroflexi bacterium OLB14]
MGRRQTVVEECDPWAVLAITLLERARRDARRGDLAALAWLVFAGIDWAERIAPGAGDSLLVFCQDVLQKIEAGRVKATWDGALQQTGGGYETE